MNFRIVRPAELHLLRVVLRLLVVLLLIPVSSHQEIPNRRVGVQLLQFLQIGIGMGEVSGIEVHLRKVGIRLPAIGIDPKRLLKELPGCPGVSSVEFPLGLGDRPLNF